MIFKETPNKQKPAIILLHGGGLSAWSWQSVAEALQGEFQVVTPVLDGHGENGAETFISIEDSAGKLLDYIDGACGGQVFALGGLSLGAQIAAEALSRRARIAQYAILESALVYPIPGVAAVAAPAYKLLYGLVKNRWFSHMQGKALYVPGHRLEQYYQDSLQMSRQSLVNLTLSNGNYAMKESIGDTQAKVLILAGEKEIRVMRRSARRLHEAIPGSKLCLVPGMKHGELSLAHPEQYVALMRAFFASEACPSS